MYRWLRQISRDENFMNCISLTDRAINEQYDVRLLFGFDFSQPRSVELKNIGDFDEFLTEKMRKMATAQDFEQEREERYFGEIFQLLAGLCKEIVLGNMMF